MNLTEFFSSQKIDTTFRS